jgi:hypothetical protein
MILSENRFPLFGIMLHADATTRSTNTNPGVAAPGFFAFRDLSTDRLQLAIFVEYRAAIARDAPAMGGERCATLEQVAPGHAGRAIAHSRGCGLARGKLGKIDRAGGSCGYADKKASGKHRLHAGSIPRLFAITICLPFLRRKIQPFVHCTKPGISS